MKPSSVQTVETSKPKARAKVLSHLELHPQLGGGYIVRHVYSAYEHEPKEVKFNKEGKSQGGEHIVHHLMKHAGLPSPGGEEYEQEGPETEEEVEKE